MLWADSADTTRFYVPEPPAADPVLAAESRDADILDHEKLTLEEFEKQWYFAIGWQRRIPERAMIGLDIGYDD